MKRKICNLLVIFIILIVIIISIYAGLTQDQPIEEKSQSTEVIVVETLSTPVPVYTQTVIENTMYWDYVLRGQQDTVTVKVYPELYEHLTALPDVVLCYRILGDKSQCNQKETRDYYLKYLDEPTQKRGLSELVNQIKTKTTNPEDQVRIAVSLVQNIPYQFNNTDNYNLQYPYETLYLNSGVCSDKSVLLVYLLRELGYASAVMSFDKENHAAVGIMSRSNYSYKDTGYAFIETTVPSIITDSYEVYGLGIGKLTSTPQIIELSQGVSFNNLSEEYDDAKRYAKIYNEGKNLSPLEYRDWEIQVWKYGLTRINGSGINEDPRNKPLCENGNEYCNDACYKSCEGQAKWSCTTGGGVCVQKSNGD